MIPWIQTFTGRAFVFDCPQAANIVIEDIAHHLAIFPRFTGATREPYSVAQHSLLVSEIVPGQLALQGLLHDAAEAYLGDVSAPLKRLIGAEYHRLEALIHAAICDKFNIPTRIDARVKQADLIALATERRDLMGFSPVPWEIDSLGIEPLQDEIEPYGWALAEHYFLDRFRELTQS